MHWFLSKLLPTLLTLLCVALIINNMATPATLLFNEASSYSLPLGVLLAAFFTLGIVSSTCAYLGLKTRLMTKVKQQELRREQAQVSSESAQEKINALEAKVRTLETALEKAVSRPV
jgi:uncharacterized integral membrane protein